MTPLEHDNRRSRRHQHLNQRIAQHLFFCLGSRSLLILDARCVLPLETILQESALLFANRYALAWLQNRLA